MYLRLRWSTKKNLNWNKLKKKKKKKLRIFHRVANTWVVSSFDRRIPSIASLVKIRTRRTKLQRPDPPCFHCNQTRTHIIMHEVGNPCTLHSALDDTVFMLSGQ